MLSWSDEVVPSQLYQNVPPDYQLFIPHIYYLFFMHENLKPSIKFSNYNRLLALLFRKRFSLVLNNHVYKNYLTKNLKKVRFSFLK